MARKNGRPDTAPAEERETSKPVQVFSYLVSKDTYIQASIWVAEEKKNRAAFSRIAGESSDDAETKARGGDLVYQSREELERSLGKALADVAFATGDDETAKRLNANFGRINALVFGPQDYAIVATR